MSVRIGEVWSDVPPLPDVRTAKADLYLRFPTIRSAERARDHLVKSGYSVSFRDDPYVLSASGVDPRAALRSVVDILTQPERVDTLAVLQPPGIEMQSIDHFSAMSVEQLANRVGATWLVDLLRSQSLVSVFQPIAEARNPAAIVGYEVLARGYRGGEAVETSRMFAVAESSHLLSQLDTLAMQTALTTAAEARVGEQLFVNCSPGHMHDPFTRVAEIAEFCHRLGLHPSRIVLEVVLTERLDVEHLRTFMLACKQHGFRVALDDLGSGYSSLTRLAELRPDLLKFDRDLVSGVNVDPYRAIIFNRLLEASHVLALETVVEGVETRAELSWAVSNGATYVQGYLIGKPAALT